MRAVATQLVLALFTAACGLAFAPAFGGRLVSSDFAPGALIAAVLTAAFVPAVVVTVARRLDTEAVLATAAGLVATALTVVLVSRPGTAIFSGAYRLLTSALPAQPDGPATATVGGLTGLASLVAALVAGYSRFRPLAVVPPFVCLLAALALDAGIRQPPLWYAAVVLVVLGGALALIREPLGHTHPVGRASLVTRLARRGFPLAGAAAILAVGALLATTFAADLPAVGHRAADARNLVEAPLRPRTALNPLQQYPAFAGGTETLKLTGTSSRRLDQLTLVTLGGFNGYTWTTSANFRRAGRTLRDVPETPSVSIDVDARDASPLSWLVRPDRPTSIDQDDLGINESTGDLVVPGGVKYPKRYRVSGTVPTLPTAALRTDTAVRYTGPVSSGTAPLPKSLSDFADRVRTAKTDDLKMLSLQAVLRGNGYYVDDTATAPSGNGYYQLKALLEAKSKHLGTSEQYASAFAVMARYLGFESRLVVGFEPRYAKGAGNRFTITGQDVHAWAQVHYAGAGWVTYDPTPSRSSSQAKPQPNPAGASPRPSASSSQPHSSAPPPTTAPPTPADARQKTGTTNLALLISVIAIVLVVLAAATPPGFKAGRRRRRRGAERPAHAVYGAWRETGDRLTEVGLSPQRGRLTSEVARDAPASVRDDVSALGRLLDRAGYAPEAAGPDDANAAWRHADDTTRSLRKDMSPLRRVLAVLDPRPLWRR